MPEFARTEMMVFLHHIVLNFDWKVVDPHESICIDPIPTFTKDLQLQNPEDRQRLVAIVQTGPCIED